MTAVAAPASGIRANEPYKTPNPSTAANNVPSTSSDPGTLESGSETSDPSSMVPKGNDPKKTDTKAKAKASKDPKIPDPSSDSADPQDARPEIPGPENTPATASEQSSPKLENGDTKQADPPLDSQGTQSQVLDGQDTPAKVQGSIPELSKSDDSTADSPSTGNSQATAPNAVSHSAALGEENAGESSHGDNTYISSPSGEHISAKNSQGDEIVDSDTQSIGSLHGEPEIGNSKSKDAAVSAPSSSSVAEIDANEDNISDVSSVHEEPNPFDILSAELNGALSPSAASGNGQPSKPKNAHGTSAPQSDNLEFFPSGDSLNTETGTAEVSPAPQYSPKTHQALDPNNIDSLSVKILLADGSTRVPLRSADDSTQLASIILKDSSRTTGATDPATEASRVSGFSQTSPSLATVFAEESGSAPSSAIVATPALGLVSEGTTSSSRETQGLNVNSAASSKAESFANKLLAYKRRAEKNTSNSAGALFHWICTVVLPLWPLILTSVL